MSAMRTSLNYSPAPVSEPVQPAADLHKIRLRDFFAQSADVAINVDNTKVYLPDVSWTRTFAKGLQKVDFTATHIIEVGVGSGVNMAGLMLHPARKPQFFIGSDLAGAAVDASADLAVAHKMNAMLLESDLLSNIPAQELRRADYIIGCIPQVPLHHGDMRDERDLSDYYEETGIAEDKYGLGLVARLLDQAADVAPQATLVLNIAGRPGDSRLAPMFERHGYETQILYTNVVRQDPGTSLRSLVEIENDTSLNFHFFQDAKAQRDINAHAAEALRGLGKPVYHNLHVMSAKLV
ncbi:MAG: hypothetical protein DI551_00025 [Micavibrio aeruginosavorus]|uniref:Methyltransferase small domain-containing protein n=1 Tax=Micavibrio aeruginosavorus TaxID=349221 RepID=A0A2W5NE89_9BACT|nr:MAG: hypothetical protein DI551_00025 [Micavibrio aeruginosavorus]